MTSLSFLGAARMVSGSRLLVTADARILVDCGMFLGYKHDRLRNWDPFPVPAASIDAVILTQARIDHAGWLPRLVREGYTGPVYATDATRALCRVLLPGHGRLEEEDAARAKAGGYSRHEDPEPLFTKAEGMVAAERIRAVADETVDIGGFDVMLSPAGNLPGAASVRIEAPDTSILVSGDLGRRQDPLLHAPRPRQAADHVVIEATYGLENHGTGTLEDALWKIVDETVSRDGQVLIPASPVGRTQAILHALSRLRAEGRLGAVPVYVDSPMAKEATRAFCDHPSAHRLGRDACLALMDVAHFTRSVEDGEALADVRGPAIIIAAEELVTTGRVLEHFKRLATDERNAVVLVGHVVPGTRGYALLQGASAVKVHGDMVDVRAQVHHVPGGSAHADQQGLLRWLGDGPTPKGVFIVHGDDESADALRVHIEDRFGCPVHVPSLGDEVSL